MGDVYSCDTCGKWAICTVVTLLWEMGDMYSCDTVVGNGRYIVVILRSAYVDCEDKVQIFECCGIYLPLLGDVYGCDAWSVILREEHRLRVFEPGAS
jgi:hypothetical protein